MKEIEIYNEQSDDWENYLIPEDVYEYIVKVENRLEIEIVQKEAVSEAILALSERFSDFVETNSYAHKLRNN